MTVSKDYNKHVYEGNGLTVAWPFDFELPSLAGWAGHVADPRIQNEPVGRGDGGDGLFRRCGDGDADLSHVGEPPGERGRS